METGSQLKIFLLLIASCFALNGNTQPLHKNFAFPFLQQQFPFIYSTTDSSFHSAIKPFYNDASDQVMPVNYNSRFEQVGRQLFHNDSAKKLLLGVSPLFDVYAGQNGYIAGGGAMAEISFTDKLGGAFFWQTAKHNLSGYRDSLLSDHPANSRYGFIDQDNPATETRGYLAYKPFSFLTLEAGKGKLFIGDGYRSVLLSDFAPAFPYLRMTTRFWKLSYTNLFTSFRNSSPDGDGFGAKYAAIHYLDWNVTKWMSFGLFEVIIFEPRRESGFDAQYLNPVIFYRPLEYSVGSADNALLGSNLKLTIKRKFILYGQMLLDEFLLSEIKADIQHQRNPADTSNRWGWWANKYAYQAGMLLINPVEVDGINYSLRAEFNGARPFTYSHAHESQSYTSSGMPLAHPLGANFRESVFILNLSRKNAFFRAKTVVANYGENEGSFNFGRNPLDPYGTRATDFQNFTGQGINSDLVNHSVEAGYIFHYASGLSASVGWSQRKLDSYYTGQNENYLFLTLRSGWLNSYTDR